jgi:diacylglycerol kinase family enzyme
VGTLPRIVNGMHDDGQTNGNLGRAKVSASTASTHGLDSSETADPDFSNRGPWVGVVANRGSGSGRGFRLVQRLSIELEKLGIGVQVAWSPAERHALVALSARDASCRCLVVAGGDGTVGAVLNEQPRRPIAILPAGTENLTAAHFRHRANPRILARTIVEGRARPVDLGQANGRRFMLMAGFGFDGDVVSRHHRGRVRRGSVRPTNRAAYVEPILRSSFSYTFPLITATIDDPNGREVLQGTTVFVFNLPRYALGLPFAPSARDDDGYLDLLVFRNPGPFHALYYLLRVVFGNHLRDPGVTYRRVRRLTLSSDERVPVQLDGDPAGFLGPSANDSKAGPEGANSRDYQTAGSWDVSILPGEVEMLIPPRPRLIVSRGVALAGKDRSR